MLKKLFLILALLGLMFAVSKAQAGEKYTTYLESYTIVGSTPIFAGAYPTIAGAVDIDKITFMTTNTITFPLIIGMYDNATSTTAAAVTRPQYFVLTGSVAYSPAQQERTYEFPYYNPLHADNPAFFKADGDTTHHVWVNIYYR